ncbi:MAG TPA: Ppx/GppA phosphatase family protein, partial [Tepidisphaeraceae bacterium]|nr:Ppx/GppA phosphatase family protein [Tepidisphaeraceae bacterium]
MANSRSGRSGGQVSSAASARPPIRLAAIDVGSNSIHMVIAQAESGGGLTTICRMKEMVGLGRISFRSNRLTKETMRRAMLVLGRFQQAALHRGADKIIAVATSAVREAENGGDFLRRAWNQLGLRIKVVAAREEARLIYLAVRHSVALKREPTLVIDIGGGSVEFIVGNDKQAMVLESRKLGAARMTSQFVRSDPISSADRQALTEHYKKEVASVRQAMGGLAINRVIGTSGTMENLAAMCAGVSEAPAPITRPAFIDRNAFEQVLGRLLKADAAERSRIAGLDEQRKDQIVAGALLVHELFEEFGFRRIQICPTAMREGILLDYLARHVPDLAIRSEVPDPRRRSVIDLGRRCDWHRGHAEHVTQLALQLFDQTRSLHGLSVIERELLEYASLLHDIGWHISGKSHHKHSMYLILNGNLKDFTPEETTIMACIARYHRKSLPRA